MSDDALFEAAHVVNGLLANRPDLRETLIATDLRVVVMHRTEALTDLPEKRHLQLKECWDKRARSSSGRITSCGEENVLQDDNDRFRGQSMLVHQLAHSLHGKALH